MQLLIKSWTQEIGNKIDNNISKYIYSATSLLGCSEKHKHIYLFHINFFVSPDKYIRGWRHNKIHFFVIHKNGLYQFGGPSNIGSNPRRSNFLNLLHPKSLLLLTISFNRTQMIFNGMTPNLTLNCNINVSHLPHCPFTNHTTYYLYFAMRYVYNMYNVIRTFIWIVVYMLICYEFQIINQSHSCIICCVSNFSLVTIYHAPCERQFHYHLLIYRSIFIHCITYFNIQHSAISNCSLLIAARTFSFIFTCGLLFLQTSYC